MLMWSLNYIKCSMNLLAKDSFSNQIFSAALNINAQPKAIQTNQKSNKRGAF